MNDLVKKIFGLPGSKKRRTWYWAAAIAGPAALAFMGSAKEDDIIQFLLLYFGFYIALLVIFLGFFFIETPGVEIIKSWRHLRKIKKTLDPVALAIAADTSSRCDPQSGKFYHYYKFPDGNFLTLEIWSNGFNVFQPNWNPGYEKHTEGLEILNRSIEKLRSAHKG